MRKNIWGKLLFSLLYLAFAVAMYRLGVGCLFRTVFHVPCPGCGMTRAVLCLLRLDFGAALGYHPMVFALPVMYLYFLFDGKLFRKKWLNVCIWIAIGLGFALHWGRLLSVEFC